MLKAGKELAQRRRRLILDDDGDVVYFRGAEEGPESFCKIRLAGCLGTAVDIFVWCVTWGIGITGSNTVRYWQNQKLGIPFQDNMPDPTTVVENFCKGNGLEVFGSIRMNDCHDAFGIPHGKLVYPLKVEHPEFLIGEPIPKARPDDGLAAAMWSGLDYAHPEVREDRFWWIQHAAEDYDLDGVDLNFFRMP